MSTEREIEQVLAAQRPAPRAGYRGSLRRHLMAIGAPSPRPANLRALSVLLAVGGIVLLAIGTLSIVGIGPLAA